jgi:hypothetical protein
MSSSRQQRMSRPLRAFTAAFVVVWAAGLLLCEVNRTHADANLLDSIRHNHHGMAADQSEMAHDCVPAGNDATDGDSELPGGQKPANGRDCGENDCCLSFQAVRQSEQSMVMTKPEAKPVILPAIIPAGGLVAVVPSPCASPDHLRVRDWVCTPEVFLGPGIRSHAPPS